MRRRWWQIWWRMCADVKGCRIENLANWWHHNPVIQPQWDWWRTAREWAAVGTPNSDRIAWFESRLQSFRRTIHTCDRSAANPRRRPHRELWLIWSRVSNIARVHIRLILCICREQWVDLSASDINNTSDDANANSCCCRWVSFQILLFSGDPERPCGPRSGPQVHQIHDKSGKNVAWQRPWWWWTCKASSLYKSDRQCRWYEMEWEDDRPQLSKLPLS